MIKVSIGISAHNEEKNIQKVLKAILKQKQDSWQLEEIIIYCDGCTDSTEKKVNSLKNPVIKVINDGERHGKPFRIGQILKIFSGDIVVVFDADIYIPDNDLISRLITGFDNPKVMLVGGNTRPVMPKTFFEEAVYSTFMVFDESRKNIKGGNNMFGCTGACIALRKSFALSIKFPKVFNEDDFLYFSCLKKGYKFKHVSSAIVYYKLPKKLKDYLKQVFRSNPEAVIINFKEHFGDLVKKEYYRSPFFYAKSVLKVFVKKPIPVLYISLVNAICIPFFPIISKNYKQSWYTAQSTK